MNGSGTRIKARGSQGAPHRFGTFYRSDLQGLRAVAVILVLIFHAGVPWLPGGYIGVDVFFVLSGYLITSVVVREIEATGTFSLKKFYVRRIIRIVPAATLVLCTVAIATLAFMPITQWDKISREIIGSTLYFSNWQFAQSANYLNADSIPSPLQHYWSLSIEEQYYILWPILLLFGIYYLRRARQYEKSRLHQLTLRYSIVIVAVIVSVSFTYSVIAVKNSPELAYFVTPSRLWEIGIGSLLALSAPWLRAIPPVLTQSLGAVGIGAILLSGVTYGPSTPFPGAAALVPTLGAAAVIISGLDQHSGGPVQKILSIPPLVWVGNISYALYLWHWPLLIFATQNHENLSPLIGVIIGVSAVIPAYLSTRLLELPIRTHSAFHEKSRNAFILGGLCMTLSLAMAASVAVILGLRSPTIVNKFDPDQAGAAALSASHQPENITELPENVVPSLAVAAKDNPRIYDDGCHLEVSATVPQECAYGSSSGFSVLLVGDSHAAQWFPMLERIAHREGFQLISMTKSSCPYADVDIYLSGSEESYRECREWNENVRHYIAKKRPSVIVTSSLGSYIPFSGNKADLEQGFRESWKWSNTYSKSIIILNDTPYMRENIPDCLARNAENVQNCATPRDIAYQNHEILARAAQGLPGVTLLELNDRICPGDQCLPVIGNVIVYRDQHHLSASYSQSLAQVFWERARGIIPGNDSP